MLFSTLCPPRALLLTLPLLIGTATAPLLRADISGGVELTPFETPEAPAPENAPASPAAAAAQANGYELPPVLRAQQLLLPEYLQGADFTVDPPVPTYAGRNSYTIRSTYGRFHAEGSYELVQRIQEIRAIAKLEELSKTDLYVDALKAAAKSPIQLADNLATNPVKTIAGVPKGVFKFINRAGNSIKEKVEGRPQNDYEDSGLQSAIGFSKAKRELAKQLGINPYTSNEVLQKELNGVAWAAYAGKMTFSVALLPVGGAAGQVMTGVNLSTAATSALYDLDPVDLRERNGKTLRSLGISEDEATRFLNHPSYSPVYQTAVVDSLEALDGVRGRATFLEAANNASDEGDAIFYMRSAQLMAAEHQQNKLASVNVIDGLPVCFGADEGLIIPLEWDYACWTQGADTFSTHVRNRFAGSDAPTSIRLVISGTASPLLKKELAARNIALSEKALPGPLR